jgi:hypothetical protein
VHECHGVVVASGVPLTIGATPRPGAGGATAAAALFSRARKVPTGLADRDDLAEPEQDALLVLLDDLDGERRQSESTRMMRAIHRDHMRNPDFGRSRIFVPENSLRKKRT